MKKQLTIYPILLAIYPIIFLFAYNIEEVQFRELAAPLITAVISATVLFAIFKRILKNTEKSAISTSIIIIIFFTYGYIFDYLENFNITIATFRHKELIAIILFLLIYLIYSIHKTKISFRSTTRLFNSILIVLIIINIVSIGLFQVREVSKKTSIEDEKQSGQQKDQKTQTNSSNDIYYIILDEYPSLSTVKNIYNYQNTSLENFLQEMGFYIATDSQTKHTSTWYSLAESLNMKYIVRKETPIAEITNNFEEYEVPKYLSSKGYKYVEISNRKLNPQDCYNKTTEDSESFNTLILEITILRPFIHNLFEEGEITRCEELKKLDSLLNSIDIAGPKFVYTHLKITHTPFVFDKNGDKVGKENYKNWKDKSYYLDSYIFLNSKLKVILSEIIEKSPETIIIVQSDHGPRGGMGKAEINNPKRLDLGFEFEKIFNAYYFPDKNYNELSRSIAPANSFRVIFNKYFADSFNMLTAETK